ncbi:hypothetical protein CsSME_00024949 [Camellia sinensis var. sinensis]
MVMCRIDRPLPNGKLLRKSAGASSGSSSSASSRRGSEKRRISTATLDYAEKQNLSLNDINLGWLQKDQRVVSEETSELFFSSSDM